MRLERARSVVDGIGPETLLINSNMEFDRLAKDFATWHVPSSDPEVIQKLEEAGLTVSAEPIMPCPKELERVWKIKRENIFKYKGRRYRRVQYTSRTMRNTTILSEWRDNILDSYWGSFNHVFWISSPDTWATPQSWKVVVFERL